MVSATELLMPNMVEIDSSLVYKYMKTPQSQQIRSDILVNV